MPRKVTVSKQTIDAAIKDYQEGTSIDGLGRKYGYDPSTFRRYLIKAGVPLRKRAVRTDEGKSCTKCWEFKALSEFGMRTGIYSFVPLSWCKDCHKQYRESTKHIAAAREKQWRTANLTHTRNTRSIRLYGISLEDQAVMLDRQGGCCGLCKKLFDAGQRKCVDHCHQTGKVRGIICFSCNTALGKLGDNEEGLLRALAYVRGVK